MFLGYAEYYFDTLTFWHLPGPSNRAGQVDFGHFATHSPHFLPFLLLSTKPNQHPVSDQPPFSLVKLKLGANFRETQLNAYFEIAF